MSIDSRKEVLRRFGQHKWDIIISTTVIVACTLIALSDPLGILKGWINLFMFTVITALFVFSLSKARNRNEKWSISFEILNSLIISVGFSYALLTISGQRKHIVALGPDGVTIDEQFYVFFMVAILLFTFDIVARFSGEIEKALRGQGDKIGDLDRLENRLSDQMKHFAHLSEIQHSEIKRMRELVTLASVQADRLEQSHLGVIAAKALGLRDVRGLLAPSLEKEGKKFDRLMMDAIDPAIDTIRTWVAATMSRFPHHKALSFPGDAARKAWLRALCTYYQEEKYDLTRFEVATNVRNYAFMLINVIRTGLEAIKSQELSGKKLIVCQVTCFPPKDFYNFPDGTSEDRFYHDPVFYGTYRRALSLVLSAQKVEPRRIILCAREQNLENNDGRNAEKGGLRALGWALDPIDKIMNDCIDMYVFGPAIRLCGKEKFRNIFKNTRDMPDAETLDVFDRLVKAAATKRDVKQYMYVPFFIHFTETRQPRPLQEGRRSTDDAGNVATRFGVEGRNVDAQIKALSDIGRNLRHGFHHPATIEKIGSDLESEESARFRELLARVAATNRTDAGEVVGYSGDSLELIESKLLSADVNLKQKCDEIVERTNQPSWSAADGLDDAAKALSHAVDLADLRDDILAAFPNDGRGDTQLEAFQNVATPIALVLEISQAIDSKIATVWSLMSDVPFEWKGQRIDERASGPSVGPAERWLYHFLNLIDFCRYRQQLMRQGTLPVWQRFQSDILGLETLAEPTKAASRFRIVPLRLDKPPTTGHNNALFRDYLQEQRISPEFMMLGVADATTSKPDGDPTEVKWFFMITAEVSEPFSTCRISHLTFSDDPRDKDDPFHRHKTWVENAWQESRGATINFLRQIEDSFRANSGERPQ